MAAGPNRRLAIKNAICLVINQIEGFNGDAFFSIVVSDDTVFEAPIDFAGLVVAINGVPTTISSIDSITLVSFTINIDDPLAPGQTTLEVPGQYHGIQGIAGGMICPTTYRWNIA